MAKTNFNKLPSEVLLVVFGFLDKKTLLNASLVCQTWCDLIGSSKTSMENLTLHLNKRNLPSKGDQFKRKYQNVEIRFGNISFAGNDFFKTALEKILDAFDFSSTTNLTIATLEKAEIPQIMTLLSQMPELENLSLILQTCTNLFNHSRVKHVSLPKLKTLTTFYHGRHNYVLNYLRAVNLTELKIVKTQHVHTRDKFVANFVKCCSKLKKLILGGNALEEMIRKQQKFDFQLVSLKIGHMKNIWGVEDNFNEFLVSQSSTLVDLKCESALELSSENIQTIFRIRNLRKLELTSSLSYSLTNYSNLNLVTTLNELTISDDDIQTRFILEKCPQLKTLRLVRWFSHCLEYICVHQPHLVRLSIDFILGSKTEDELVHLKYLQVQHVSDDFILFIAKSPSIETIDVEKFPEHKIREKQIDKMLQGTELSHLILSTKDFICDDKVFVSNDMKSNEKLRSLRLNFISFSDFGKFELLIDKSNWSIEEREDVKVEICKKYPSLGELIKISIILINLI